jgi:ankyrin repeat protein
LAGANVNVKDDNANTPLHLAVIGNRIRAVNVLLQYGADINVLDQFHRSPLDCAQSRLNLIRQRTSSGGIMSQLGELIDLLRNYAKRRRPTTLAVIPEDISDSLDSLADKFQNITTEEGSGDKSETQNEPSNEELVDRLQSLLDRIRLM